MIQTLRLLNILIFITTIVFSYTPYVIYTSNSFSDAANLMKEIHTEMIPEKYGYEPLDVIIKYKEVSIIYKLSPRINLILITYLYLLLNQLILPRISKPLKKIFLIEKMKFLMI